MAACTCIQHAGSVDDEVVQCGNLVEAADAVRGCGCGIAVVWHGAIRSCICRCVMKVFVWPTALVLMVPVFYGLGHRSLGAFRLNIMG